MRASTVLSVGSTMSMSRLWVRSSYWSRASLLTCGEISTVKRSIFVGSGTGSPDRLPGDALVFGVTARVLETVVGPGAWSLGVPEAPARFGAGHPTGAGAGLRGARTAPLAYAADLPLLLTPEGADFVSGRVRFAVHHLSLPIPPA